MNRKLLLFLLVFVAISSVNASKESEWLIDEGNQGVWSNIRETSWGILALKQESGYENEILNGSKYLINQLESCMVSNSCDVKDTAIALWALKDVGGNPTIVGEVSTWLLNSRSMIFTGDVIAPNQNEWIVQVVSNVAGECTLINTETGASETILVSSSDGYVPWHLISDTVLSSYTEDLNLDCDSLGSNSILSLINKKIDDNNIENYYIKQEEHSQNNVSVSFGNPCWGRGYRDGSCSNDVTAYVLYALKKAGKSGDPSWLKEQTLGLSEKAFLFKITNDGIYLQDIISEKNSLGYWGTADLYLTSLLYTLLKPNAITNDVGNWISSRRDNQGCWPKNNCNTEQTALVLYSGSYEVSTQGCANLDGDEFCDNDDNDIDGDGLLNDLDPFPRNPDANNNDILDGDEDLDGDGFLNKEDSDIDGDGISNENDRDPFDETVGGTDDGTSSGGESSFVPGSVCVTYEGCEGEYDTLGQCIDVSGDGCPSTDNSGGFDDDFDDDFTGGSGSSSDGSSSTPPEEESSVVLWVLLVLLLLISLIGGGFLAYKKGLLKLDFIKKNPKPEASYKPRLNTSRSPQSYVPRMAQKAVKQVPKIAKGIEDELDQSMKDLEKLLGKK
jgi:hypothetical protein